MPEVAILLVFPRPQVDGLIGSKGDGGSPVPAWALVLVLAAVLITGIMDGVAQPAVFMDAAQAGEVYTHVGVARLEHSQSGCE